MNNNPEITLRLADGGYIKFTRGVNNTLTLEAGEWDYKRDSSFLDMTEEETKSLQGILGLCLNSGWFEETPVNDLQEEDEL